MKIQHIRNASKEIQGTLLAIKDEAKGVVKIGWSIVREGDIPCKKSGVKIALGRAERRTSRVISQKIWDPFVEFITHCNENNYFKGFRVPVPEDYEPSYKPLHEHKQRDPIKEFFAKRD